MESEKTQFLSDEQAERFQEEALRPVEAAISDSFSEPDEFLEDGTRFHLSEYRPMGFLAETAEEIGLELTVLDVPPKYCVRLKLDKALTQEKSDLVFALTEESDKVEFSRKTFTISELERNFRSGVR